MANKKGEIPEDSARGPANPDDGKVEPITDDTFRFLMELINDARITGRSAENIVTLKREVFRMTGRPMGLKNLPPVNTPG